MRDLRPGPPAAAPDDLEWHEARCTGPLCRRIAFRVAPHPSDRNVVIVQVKCACKVMNEVTVRIR